MELDPEILPALQERVAASAGTVLPERGDVLGLRALIEARQAESYAALPPAPEITVTAHRAGEIDLRWCVPPDGGPGSAVVYLHGGGMIAGTLDGYDPMLRHYTQLTGIPFLAVEYRRAPEHPGTGPAEDAFAALRWLVAHAAEFGVDPRRIALMGDSGGGGIAAGAAVLAREAGVPVARQVLIYPMLDDRTVEPDPLLAPTATWTYDNNATAWEAVLGDARGGPDVPPVAAPARLTDMTGLPPTYLEVGELDIFRDECLAFAGRLLAAGVSCELHVRPGAPHGFEWLAKKAEVSRRALADRVRVIRSV
ncbi:Acetyl esterase/lipase [Pseudonocardia thermophila]|uniref:Acetyl esterase/lipase n=1 Tax=Pseudonocardia thermophila TaxID=1848 RepID=A0A1M6T262_PSETH|nr:alpha/beta hydrolase [Pseudonocardia thermophila]SHK51045.1 Acetyl esterase/lipase [Pseudonocardia thermophila]